MDVQGFEQGWATEYFLENTVLTMNTTMDSIEENPVLLRTTEITRSSTLEIMTSEQEQSRIVALLTELHHGVISNKSIHFLHLD